MKTVIYARYSSERQNEQSIEGQLRECYAYAKAHGLTVVKEYIDRAISGKAAENREADPILVLSQSINTLFIPNSLHFSNANLICSVA